MPNIALIRLNYVCSAAKINYKARSYRGQKITAVYTTADNEMSGEHFPRVYNFFTIYYTFGHMDNYRGKLVSDVVLHV